MAKQLTATVKFHATGGKATAAPPVGTALGKYGLNLGQFVQQFNERTKDNMGMRIPVVVKVYSDRTFDLETKSPHSVDLLKSLSCPISMKIFFLWQRLYHKLFLLLDAIFI